MTDFQRQADPPPQSGFNRTHIAVKPGKHGQPVIKAIKRGGSEPSIRNESIIQETLVRLGN